MNSKPSWRQAGTLPLHHTDCLSVKTDNNQSVKTAACQSVLVFFSMYMCLSHLGQTGDRWGSDNCIHSRTKSCYTTVSSSSESLWNLRGTGTSGLWVLTALLSSHHHLQNTAPWPCDVHVQRQQWDLLCVLSDSEDTDQGPWSHYRTTAQQWGCSSHRSLRGDPYPTVSFAQYRRPHGTHVVSTRTATCWQDIPICPDRKLQITKMAARERQIVQRSVELAMNFHNLWLSSNPGWIRECRFWTHYRKKSSF